MQNCHQYSETLLHYFNLCEYSLADLIIVGIGTLCWVISYIAIIRHGFKTKFLEMPVFVAVGNIAWEFIWSFVFKTNMGEFYLWGYRAWFFLDLAILYLVIRYGAKQFNIEVMRSYYKPIVVGLLLFFGFFFYYFVKGGYDTPIGATSAFFLSIGISTLYINLLLLNKNAANFSLTSGIFRAIGDTVLTIFVIKYTGIMLIAVMGAYVIVLDFTYVILLYRMKREATVKKPVLSRIKNMEKIN